jgi:hypothetical protein
VEFVIAAVHSHPIPVGKALLFIGVGIFFVIAGLTAIVKPGSFRNYPLNPDQTPQAVLPGHDAIARVLGAICCAGGVGFVILAITKMA